MLCPKPFRGEISSAKKHYFVVQLRGFGNARTLGNRINYFIYLLSMIGTREREIIIYEDTNWWVVLGIFNKL
jgi:hypothetical protein